MSKAKTTFAPTHETLAGEKIKAVQWRKDGDHPAVERYPIERREYKGILVVDEKTKFALRFGDWVCEDEQGRVWVVPKDRFVGDCKAISDASGA